jgi:hypothetical protein
LNRPIGYRHTPTNAQLDGVQNIDKLTCGSDQTRSGPLEKTVPDNLESYRVKVPTYWVVEWRDSWYAWEPTGAVDWAECGCWGAGEPTNEPHCRSCVAPPGICINSGEWYGQVAIQNITGGCTIATGTASTCGITVVPHGTRCRIQSSAAGNMADAIGGAAPCSPYRRL